jgi:hypothetical protein
MLSTSAETKLEALEMSINTMRHAAASIMGSAKLLELGFSGHDLDEKTRNLLLSQIYKKAELILKLANEANKIEKDGTL